MTNHPPVKLGKTGVLLINLGTPAAPTAKAIKPYLREFLSDRRVIETSPLIWQPILRGIILNTRPRKSAKAYAKIWRKESNESPLRYYTRRQAELLDEKIQTAATAKNKSADNIVIEWAMRYGQPSIMNKLAELREQGCDRILAIALYPQYSATTSASVYDEVFSCLKKMRWQPAIRTAPPWHDSKAYIDALSKTVRQHLTELDWKPDRILASYHGLPQKYFEQGDPYHCHCLKTTRLLREKMKFDDSYMQSAFQSRFGPTQWLQPYTDKTVESWAEQGVKNLVILTPGFISDCVETLEEIAIELKHSFLEAGGEAFSVIPCLNDTPQSIDLLGSIYKTETSGWT
jgi:protoporphyrin/coproporphyrin ferrochelatase